MTNGVFSRHKLIIVSNREPYIHQHRDGRVVCLSPAGGLTSALKPVIAAVGGTWVAQAVGSADREAASRRGRVSVPPDDPAFTLKRVWIPQSLRDRYYDGLANQALWPLCHNVYCRPVFRDSDWQGYQRVNALFAEAVLEEAAGQPAVVFVQDYHLALLPRMLKERAPNLTVAQFWHIPWPNSEVVQTFPWLRELLEGMLGNDLLAFHLGQHCSNFLGAVESTLDAGTDRVHNVVSFEDHATVVRDAPISIDFRQHTEMAASSAVDDAMDVWRKRLRPAHRIGVGIDRSDYTKGIPERLRAIGMLLEQSPSLEREFTFVQVAVPSRTDIPEYAELDRVITAIAADINARWGTAEWQPVILEKRNLPPVEMMALHRLADFCMVTPLHDGMNLVAKEFVASRFDLDGVLILSRFAGAARELKTAIQVNPFCQSSLCAAIHSALTMPKQERRRRMVEARKTVSVNNVYRWAGSLIDELDAVITSDVCPANSSVLRNMMASVA